MRRWAGFDAKCASCGEDLSPQLARCTQCSTDRASLVLGSVLAERRLCLLTGEPADVAIDDGYCVAAEHALRMSALGVIDDHFRFADVGTWICDRFETVRSGGNPKDPVHLRQSRLWLAGFDVVLRANLNLRDRSVREDLFGLGKAALAEFIVPPEGADLFEVFNFVDNAAMLFEKWEMTRGPPPGGSASQARLRLVK